MAMALLLVSTPRSAQSTIESSDRVAPSSAKIHGHDDIHQLVNDILRQRELGILPVHAQGTDLDDKFYSGLVSYQEAAALSWLTAEWELAAVKSITDQGTNYNTIAEKVLSQIKPVLDRYAPYLNSSD